MLDPGFDLIILLLADHEMTRSGSISPSVSRNAATWLFSNPGQSPALRPRSGGAPYFAAGAGIDVIVAQLRAAVGVAEGNTPSVPSALLVSFRKRFWIAARCR